MCHSIVELCRERKWQLWAAHVRSNHVHVVITAEMDPDRLMSDLKGRASRNLNLAGFDSAERKRWTRHGAHATYFRLNKSKRKSTTRSICKASEWPGTPKSHARSKRGRLHTNPTKPAYFVRA